MNNSKDTVFCQIDAFNGRIGCYNATVKGKDSGRDDRKEIDDFCEYEVYKQTIRADRHKILDKSRKRVRVEKPKMPKELASLV